MPKKSLIIVALGVIISLYSSFAFFFGFYDPFYPTSCIVLNEVSKSKADVVQHSRLYASYYPFSLIFNAIMHIVLNIDCFELGLIPYLPFLHLLLFYILISVYPRLDKQKVILLVLYSCLLVTYLYVVFPPYYITIGNTGYITFLYILLFFYRKRGIIAKDFIVLLLLFLLATFSYYTAGFVSVTTIMLVAIFNLVQEILRRKRTSENRKFFHTRSNVFMVYLITLILSLIYMYFDYVFLQNLKHIADLEFLNTIINILAYRRIEQDNLMYSPPTLPSFFLVVTKISIYFALILSTAFIIVTLMKLFRNEASLEWFIVSSALLSSFLISLYYSFLMNAIIIRSYLFFQLYLIFLVISSTKENVRKVNAVLFFTYVALFLLALSNIYGTIYSLTNSMVLSYYTSYLPEEEYVTICDFIGNRGLEYKIMADLKTAFSIPIRCNDKDLYVVVFEHKFFSYFNSSHNMMINVTKGIYFYTMKYMQTPIYMLFWKHYKPFVISYMLFDGVIYNSAFTTLWIKL
uniref:Uncharacterized protein n=1 Tax=Ignisphaera aggregans TaxID=334771 RepID=A0A7J2U3X2_9CREN